MASTAYARLFSQLWHVPVTVLRIAMVYGPRQADTSKLIPHVIGELARGRTPPISSGTRLVDWVYIDDVVDALLAAAASPAAIGEVIDIGSGRQVSVRETVERIYHIVGCESAPCFGEVADRPLDHDQRSDPTVAARLLGCRRCVGLDEGLRRTVRWNSRERDVASRPRFSQTRNGHRPIADQ